MGLVMSSALTYDMKGLDIRGPSHKEDSSLRKNAFFGSSREGERKSHHLSHDLEVSWPESESTSCNIQPCNLHKKAALNEKGGGFHSLTRRNEQGTKDDSGNDIKKSGLLSSISNNSFSSILSNNNSVVSLVDSISSKTRSSRNSLIENRKRTSLSGKANASWDTVNLAPKGLKEGTPSIYEKRSSGSMHANTLNNSMNLFRGEIKTNNGFAWPPKHASAGTVGKEKECPRQKDVFVCRPSTDVDEDDLIVGFPTSS
mmetsp:Transcript_27617/g.36681  ORF Transcript_27617/g.36681 Transcript_27617/m.36681 type:complete len:257 (-) Transcript_27617:155-925(-)